jgi:hypothetical protein
MSLHHPARYYLPTFERYADVSVAASSSYTPAAKGLFIGGAGAGGFSENVFHWDLYSTAGAVWQMISIYAYLYNHCPAHAIGDGSNLRLYNSFSGALRVVIMRMG